MTTSRWLLIVRRDRPELMVTVAPRYPQAKVVVDRRKRERRDRTDATPIERREGQRRRPLALRDLAMWDALGYLLVYLPRRRPDSKT